jgi:uncharacterized protein
MINKDDIERWATKKLEHHDASHDAVHAKNVARICDTIMKNDTGFKGDASLRVAILAIAWTHDVCDRKYVKCKEDVVGEICTALAEMQMDENAIQIVRDVVCQISFSARLQRIAEGSEHGEPELQGDSLVAYRVVSDADMLEAMGIVGMMRTFMYQAVKKHTSESAFQHIQNRLLLCKNYLFFEWSKKEGKRRHSAMEIACSHLLRERQPI